MNTQHNMAEMAAIGPLLLYPQQAGDALGLLRAEMFEAQPLADIFRCIRRMHTEGREWDGAAVAGALGPQYNELVMQCARVHGQRHQPGSYAAIVRGAWRERALKAAALELPAGGQDAGGTRPRPCAPLCAGRTSWRVRRAAPGQASPSAPRPRWTGRRAAARPCRCRAGTPRTAPAGGLAQKGVYVIAARPGRGQDGLCPANGRDAGGALARALFRRGDDSLSASLRAACFRRRVRRSRLKSCVTARFRPASARPHSRWRRALTSCTSPWMRPPPWAWNSWSRPWPATGRRWCF